MKPGDKYSTNKPLKICFISHSGGLRGAEKALLEAVDALRNYPVHPHIFTPAKGPLAGQVSAMEIDFSCYSAIPWVTTRRTIWRSIVKSLWVFPNIIRLAYQIKKQRCELVYSNSMAIAMGAWAAALAQVPHIWHIHEFGYDDHGHQFDMGTSIAKWIFQRLGGFFIFNSYVTAMRFSQMFGIDNFDGRHVVIYQSVTIPLPETQITINTSSMVPTLVIVGALHKNKGQTDAIRAVKELTRQGIETHLLLVGDGPYEHKLRELIKHLEIQNNVQFAGFAKNVSNYYACADIVLVCSRFEAFGRVAVEAMLSRKPLIASGKGGLREIVEDGVTGLFYEPGNPLELAQKIGLLLGDQTFATTIAQNGYNWAKTRFTKERYGQELYETIVSMVE